MVSQEIRAMCCGTTCDKIDMSAKVAQLERENEELQARIDDAIANSPVRREAFALRCFEAGVHSKQSGNTYKAWLDFKATEL